MTPIRSLAVLSGLALAFATPALGQDTPSTTATLTLSLQSPGDIERRVVHYQCEDEQVLSVHYLNAAPNFLAIVPVDGQNLVFATTISASGARYVAGPYEWWSHQGEATLRDLMQDENAPPLAACTETSNTP